MALYPIFINLQGMACLVVGGGPLGERKVEALLEAGARVRLISPRTTNRLGALAAEGSIEWLAREAAERDFDPVDGRPTFRLAFLCTNSAEAQRRLGRACRARGILFNAGDSPEDCEFHAPATLRRGDLAIAVSTGGACPTLGRQVRDKIEGHLDPAYAALTRIVGGVRRGDIEAGLPARVRRKRMETLLDGRLLEAIKKGGEAAAQTGLAGLLNEGSGGSADTGGKE